MSNILTAFRRAKVTNRPPLHPLERGLVAVVGIHLLFLPWALGTMHLWSQSISLALSAVSLLLAVQPRSPNGESSRGAYVPRRRLFRFPIFWLGLVVLAYIAIQALNPAYVYITDGRVWSMQGRDHIPWLPSGIEAPFGDMNGWRALIIYAAAWMTVCALWTGVTRRKSLRILAWMLVVNGLILAALGAVQISVRAREILWFYEPSNPSFLATFIYRNHGAAYFLLILAVTAGLGWWRLQESRRRMEPSSPALVFPLYILFITGLVIFSHSRGGTLVMLAFLGATFLFFTFREWRRGPANGNRWILLSIALTFGGLAVYAWQTIDTRPVERHFGQLLEERGAVTVESRASASSAGFEMLKERWVQGWGAGGFRWYFPFYARNYPEIHRDGRLFWEHLHNDWLQIPIELGALGCLPLAAGAAWWLVVFARCRAMRHPFALTAFLGLMAVLLYARMDFGLQNPAVLITWCALWPITAHWARFER